MARIGAALLVASLMVVGPRAVSAQERPAPANEPAPAAETAEAQRRMAVRVSARAERLSRRVQLHLDGARREGDARRARCLDDVLSQANAAVRMSREASARLVEGIARSNDSHRRHAVSVLGVLGRRIAELDAQGRVCNGERLDAGGNGRTRVIVTVDRDVPREDPTRLGSEPPSLPYLPPPTGPSI